MKRKFGVILFSLVLAVLPTSCDEVLSVVTEGKDGEKKVSNYVSMFSDKVYDETVSFKQWKDIDVFDGLEMDNMLFTIESPKEKIVVTGDKDEAFEISFFDGGYKYTVFSSVDSLNNMFDNFGE